MKRKRPWLSTHCVYDPSTLEIIVDRQERITPEVLRRMAELDIEGRTIKMINGLRKLRNRYMEQPGYLAEALHAAKAVCSRDTLLLGVWFVLDKDIPNWFEPDFELDIHIRHRLEREAGE